MLSIVICEFVMFSGIFTLALESLNLDTPTLCFIILTASTINIINLLPYITFLFLFAEAIGKVCRCCQELEDLVEAMLDLKGKQEKGNK